MTLEAFCEECGVRHGGHEGWCSQADADEREAWGEAIQTTAATDETDERAPA